MSADPDKISTKEHKPQAQSSSFSVSSPDYFTAIQPTPVTLYSAPSSIVQFQEVS
jgi:hypothetical protein